MKTEKHRWINCLAAFIVSVFVSSIASAAPVVWSGPMTNFTQVGFDPAQPTNQDRMTDRVWITRDVTMGLFNAASESTYTHNVSPKDTEWADGAAANHSQLSFTDWEDWAKGIHGGPPGTVGVAATVHLISQDIYVDIMFTFWGGASGGFAYQRATPGAGQAPPSVTITNPADGAVFAAPANVSITADASLPGGTVTNVQFFLNGSSLGSAQTAPFTLTANNLAPASYMLSAIATGHGLSETSSVVNISVVTPVAISNSAPMIANGQFAFDYSANPGLNYVVQKSSNLLSWASISTNTANSNPVHFTDSFVPTENFFYRVGRVPNP
ncbi:MAG TPA: Ig-like domain-containing protein [Verrucomicrobiae bacterium]|jgi:hypothetical protein